MYLFLICVLAFTSSGCFRSLGVVGEARPDADGDAGLQDADVSGDTQVDAPILALEPSELDMNVNSEAFFLASGGLPPYSFALVDGPDRAGRGTIDLSGRYVSGPNRADVTIEVTDEALQTATATVHVGGNASLWVFAEGATSGTMWSAEAGEAFVERTHGLVPKGSAAMVVYRDAIWLLGGWMSGVAATDVVSRSEDGASWTVVGQLPEARQGGAALVFEDRIWYLGGCFPMYPEAGCEHRTVWSTTDGRQWREEDPLPAPVAFLASVVFDGRMWVLGGLLRSYEAGDQLWSSEDGSLWTVEDVTLPNPSEGLFAVVHDDALWLVGGGDPSDEEVYNEVFSTVDGSWITEDRLPEPRVGGIVASLGMELIYIGGADLYDPSLHTQDSIWIFDRSAGWAVSPRRFPVPFFDGAAVVFRP